MNIIKKHFILTKSLNKARLRQGNAYKVYFKNHPKAKDMNDHGNGTICICAEVYDCEITFVNVSKHFLDGHIITNVCELRCEDIDKYDIDIVLMWDEEEIFKYIDGTKSPTKNKKE